MTIETFNANALVLVNSLRVPKLTLDPDGIGPCVALMREVLPGCEWGRNTNGHWFIFETPTVVLAWALPLANDCLRFLDAIVSALIAQEEAKHTEKAG